VPLEDPLSTLSTPLNPSCTRCTHPRYPQIALEYPKSTPTASRVPGTPQNPASTLPRPRSIIKIPVAPSQTNPPSDQFRPRTSVGARPHVVVVGAAEAGAADDVDGAGGVDHRRVRKSRSPRRAGGAACPRHTCGRTRATVGTNATHAHTRTHAWKDTRAQVHAHAHVTTQTGAHTNAHADGACAQPPQHCVAFSRERLNCVS
jgi:hypothetical protein